MYLNNFVNKKFNSMTFQVIQNISNQQLTRSLATLPPSERPKAKVIPLAAVWPPYLPVNVQKQR